MANVFGRFGLDRCDLPTIFWNVGVILRVLTININRRHARPIPCILYLFTIFIGASYVYVYIVSVLWFVLVRCPETGDFISAMVAISLTMCSITSIPKLFYMKYYSKTVMKLIDDYLHCNGLVVRGTRFETNILKVLKVVKTQATMAWTVLTLNGLIYISVPFLRPGRHFSEDLFVLYGLEPMRESPNYEVASVLLTSAVIFSVTASVHVTLFIIVIVGYLEAQMLALSKEMLNIWDDSEKYYNVYKLYNNPAMKSRARNIFLKIRLRDIVKFQIVNVNLRNKVEHELRFIFVNDLIFIILALVTELVGGLENTWIQMPFTFGIIFIDCYIGQRLIDASKEYENAIYNCKWENFNVDNQKTVLFMLQCSQKTMTLSAGGFAVLNFASLMSMLRSTYSAYTTLKSTAQK
ncbi:uncharacterized protein LOC116771535 [Danaus plexippus]|uniref:uncharacterized protein LOC116771535 n=1 Tax=Danaus plexippus TaxID=13037 RepID=UPI002AB09E2B|nr:uncharacterized protein LOC116771535 [Danaus plexippus]